MSEHLVIVGNGISGVTAARFVRKMSDARITMISAETDHFFARTALMYVYMGHLRYRDTKPYEDDFWPKNRIDLVRDFVEEIDPDAHRLRLRSGATVPYDRLLLALGSVPDRPGRPGEDADGVQGLYSWQDLERLERYSRDAEKAVVVGGGLIGIELAEMLHSRHIPTTFLVREDRYMGHVLPPEESAIVEGELHRHRIDLRLGAELDAVLPDATGRVRAVVTTGGEEIPCRLVGLTIGVRPNIDVVRRSKIETNRGVLVNEFFETSAPDVYAVGDCAEFRRDGIGHRRIEQLWYTGRRHGQTVAYTLCGRRTAYDRGIFFNSAKFFTVEYQTYGCVTPVPSGGESTLVWRHPEENRLIRINYAAESGRVLGFNVMGVRFRQDVCERWIRTGLRIDEVLARLSEANFDPEFSRRYELELLDAFNRNRPGTSVQAGEPVGFLRRWTRRFAAVRVRSKERREERQLVASAVTNRTDTL